jgi:hypothetical protein
MKCHVKTTYGTSLLVQNNYFVILQIMHENDFYFFTQKRRIGRENVKRSNLLQNKLGFQKLFLFFDNAVAYHIFLEKSPVYIPHRHH